MKMNRVLLVQLSMLLMLAVASLAGCGARDAESNRNEGMDSLRLVITSPMTDSIAKALRDQIVGQERGM